MRIRTVLSLRSLVATTGGSSCSGGRRRAMEIRLAPLSWRRLRRLCWCVEGLGARPGGSHWAVKASRDRPTRHRARADLGKSALWLLSRHSAQKHPVELEPCRIMVVRTDPGALRAAQSITGERRGRDSNPRTGTPGLQFSRLRRMPIDTGDSGRAGQPAGQSDADERHPR
jgi:hypothetical protein